MWEEKPKLTREEYEQRRIEMSPRGEELTQSKLNNEKVADIKAAFRKREEMRVFIRNNLSNAALAKKYGVHFRTIEKIAAGETWIHIE